MQFDDENLLQEIQNIDNSEARFHCLSGRSVPIDINQKENICY